MEELEEEVCHKHRKEKHQEKYRVRKSGTSNLSESRDLNLSALFSKTQPTSLDPSLVDIANLSKQCGHPSHTEAR